MGDALIDDLIGRGAASRGQVQEATRRLAASGGHLVEHLVEVGCSAERILSAWTASTGIPAAPRSALLRPIVPVGLGVEPRNWLELLALPFGTDDEGHVLIAITEPASREELLALDLPDLIAHLATPADISAGLRRAFPELFPDEAGPATVPGVLRPLASDDAPSPPAREEAPAPAHKDVPTRNLRPSSDAFDLPSTSADDDEPASDGPDDEPEEFEEDFEFDDPTQAMDSSAMLPFLEGAGAVGGAPPTRTEKPVRDDDPSLGASAFDDDESTTVAMDANDLRAALKGRGAEALRLHAATVRSDVRIDMPRGETMRADVAHSDTTGSETPAPPSLFSEAASRGEGEGEGEDDEFEPKTLAMTLEEMRASYPEQGPPSPTDDDVEPGDVQRPSFDYSAAADEFDEGDGSGELATTVLPRSTEQDDAPAVSNERVLAPDEREDETRAAAEVPGLEHLAPRDEASGLQQLDELRSRDPLDVDAQAELDEFDEKTLAADGLDPLPSPLAGEGLGPPPDTSLKDDAPVVSADPEPSSDDDSVVARPLEEEQEAERQLAEARARMAAALEGLDGSSLAEEPTPQATAPLGAALEERHSDMLLAGDDPLAQAETSVAVRSRGVSLASSGSSSPSSASDERPHSAAIQDAPSTESEATHAGVAAIDSDDSTRVSSLGPDDGPGEIGGAPTAALSLRGSARGAAAARDRLEGSGKAIDTGPTGPVAVRGYDMTDVLGAGGMATVYRARQRSADREVALKILAPHLANDAAFVARFKREIRSSASLTHPNIIRVYDYGDEGGVYFMATEVMDGGSLREALHEHGTLPVPLVVKLFEHLLRGIGHAHGRGVVHRDIKPANLMLSSEGLLKLGDFGIAKSESDENLTRTGALFGTPAYMSPEQALGRTVEARSDLFSCGIIAYELLTGENPYAAETASVSLLKVSRADAPPLLLKCPAAPPLLLDVIERLQRREARERYAKAEDALAELRPLIEAVNRRWPDLIQRYVADAHGTRDLLLKEHAQAELERARHHLAADPPLSFAGATAAYLASALDPDHAEAQELLAELAEEFHFGPSEDPRVEDAERSLEEDPRAPGLLRRISDLYRAGGNPFKAALWLRQYLGVRPSDSHARHQLGILVGPSALAGLDEWEVPIPEPSWGADLDGDPHIIAEEPAPSSSPATRSPALGLDLRPLDGGGLYAAPSPPDAPPSAPSAAPPSVRPALRVGEPSEVMRAANPRARGGLQVLRTDNPQPVPSSYLSPSQPWSPQAAGPAVQQPQHTSAVPRAEGAALAASRGSMPKALKVAVAAALSLAVVLLLVIAGMFVLSGDRTDKLVRQADPGQSVPAPERQAALLTFAREQLAEGGGVRALQAASLAYGLDPYSARGGEALLLRGRASAAVGDPNSAARDFEEVLARFPEGNLLHLEAKQQLKELPR